MLEAIDKTRFRGRKVGVVTGGTSSERDISLMTGRGFAEALGDLGYQVEVYDVPEDLERLAGDCPAAVLLGLHGGAGENGVLQGFLEANGIPYTGSGVLGSALAMDKGRAKAVIQESGVPTPWGVMLSTDEELDIQEVFGSLDRAGVAFPVIAKPNAEGSSVGVTVCEHEDDLEEALDVLWSMDAHVLVEEFIDGPEYTVGFFDRECLGAIEVVPADGFYDFESKYESSKTRYEPVEDEDLLLRLESLGRDAYNAVGCRGVARVDFKARTEEDDTMLYALEVNTIPGMTPTSLVPKLAERRGVGFAEFTEYMLAAADCRTDWRSDDSR
ncbi:MAG: D-alanine--D-alanine ligase [Persicimonas sp.]